MLVGNELFDDDGDVAGVVGEAPCNGGVFVERSAGTAGGEVAAEFGGIVDGVEDLGEGLLDLGVDLKFELHGVIHLAVGW